MKVKIRLRPLEKMINEIVEKIDFSKIQWEEHGLVPAIVQDYKDNTVLMVT